MANALFSTTSQVRTYIKTFFMPQSTNTELDQMLNHYPLDLIQGSPFGTGILNALSPQFKRLAAFQGDAVFQAPRRFFLQQRSSKQNTWAFRTLNAALILECFVTSSLVSKRFKAAPFLGSVCFPCFSKSNGYLTQLPPVVPRLRHSQCVLRW